MEDFLHNEYNKRWYREYSPFAVNGSKGRFFISIKEQEKKYEQRIGKNI